MFSHYQGSLEPNESPPSKQRREAAFEVAMNKLIVLVMKLYQVVVSPLLPSNTCRFYPTCSSYCIEAFERHGFFRAVTLSFKRICRCNPYNAGGFDAVP